jgi:lysophospholipid acyltransferase (LPLAT)-like uncharacterized protein
MVTKNPDWALATEDARTTVRTKTMDRSFIGVPFARSYWRTDEHIEMKQECQQISIAGVFSQ